MDEVHHTVKSLLEQMRFAIGFMIESRNAHFDWSKWSELVNRLSAQLSQLLGRSKGKFDSEVQTVGMMADERALNASLRQMERVFQNS
jgi:hypothetical protein